MSLIRCAILFVLIITGCNSFEPQTRDEIFKKNLIEYLKHSMHDPKSLDIIEIRLIDSVTYLNNIEHRRSNFVSYKESAESQLEYYDRNYRKDKYMKKYFKQEKYDSYLKEIERENWVINGIDSIRAAMGESVNDIASYLYSVTLRGKNTFGGKVLNTIYVQTKNAPEYYIHHIVYDMYDIDLSPNNFPGYIDLVLKSSELYPSKYDLEE
jgi:hypothetical protein